MSYKVLIVDDELPNARLLEHSLRQHYFCLMAASCSEALRLLAQHDVAVIIADQQMSGLSGIELLKRTAEYEPDAVRILLSQDEEPEVLVEAINSDQVDLYLSKPWDPEDLLLRIRQAVQRYYKNKRQHSLVVANECLRTRLQAMKSGSVRAMANVLKLSDEYLFAHGSRVSKWAELVGEKFGLSEDLRFDLEAAGLLHDLGTIVSNRPPKDDFAIIKPQQDRAAQILSCVPELQDVADIIRYQNANYDGSGYPLGLVGEQIPITSRILSVANEYDQLTNPRNSLVALSHTAAIKELQERAYRDFDPQVVEAFAELGADELADVSDLTATVGAIELVTAAIN
jgi:response regulator RpfG family c-di-GMP phosphodiesterase